MAAPELNKKTSLSFYAIGMIVAATFSVSSVLWKFNENGLEIEALQVEVEDLKAETNSRMDRKFDRLKSDLDKIETEDEKLEGRVREIEYKQRETHE